MLRRSLAICAVLAVVAVALTACNLPGSPGLSILNHVAPRPLVATSGTAPASEAATQTAGVTVTQTIALTATESAGATATPLDVGLIPIRTPAIQAVVTRLLPSSAGVSASTFDSPIPTEESTSTAEPTATPQVIPSVTIEFPTPEDTDTPEPTATAPVTSTGEASTSTPTILPSPSPASTGVAPTPTQQAPLTAAPEIVWVDDTQGFRQSKVMGWAAGQSYPITVAGKSNVTARIASFNVSSGGAREARGTWLAYTLAGSPYLFEAEIGGQQRKITPPRPGWRFRLPKWSPAADRLAFIAEALPLPGALPINMGLWTCAPDGSDLRQVVRGERSPGGPGQGVTFADWNPDGKELVYAFSGPGGLALSRWLTVPITGGAPRFLPLSGTLYDVAPDGTWLLGDGYTTVPPVPPAPPRVGPQGGPQDRRDQSYSVLMRIPADGKTAPTLLTPACWSDTEGRISPDGNRVIALSWPSISPACPRVSGLLKYELWVMNSDGSGRVALDAKNAIGREFPQWSADGQAVYYQVWGAKGPEIWRADASGTVPPEALPGTTGADRFRVVH